VLSSPLPWVDYSLLPELGLKFPLGDLAIPDLIKLVNELFDGDFSTFSFEDYLAADRGLSLLFSVLI